MNVCRPAWRGCFHLVARLNIGHRLAEPIAGALAQRVVEADRDRKWVKLRNARIPFSAANVDFICELLARLLAGDRDLLEVMDFVLGLLEELDSDGDIQAGLLEKKIFTLKISSRPNRGLAECKAATWKP